MFLLHCPHCGETRDEEEFSNAGEAYIPRPLQPEAVDDATWGDYVFMRRNTKGWFWEQWQHTAACRKVFAVKRNTATYEIAGTWTLAEGKALFLADMAKEQTQ
ncbi:sarcosine oxidase subunit delta [Polaromonas sp. CT11-55]|jgi:sarcosine oxidase subunit delta|uniref:sarcosine oxidase subunit delta n=1 Tax=Polaromonas sp. CT11-55 TaxID=3243045 RepID=UPI0039A6AE18